MFIDFLTAAETLAFTATAGLLLVFLAVYLVDLLLSGGAMSEAAGGFVTPDGPEVDLALDGDLELDLDPGELAIDADVPGSAAVEPVAAEPSGVLAWLGFGRVPLIVLILLFLSGFSASGFLIQGAASDWVGGLLPGAIAGAPAFIAGLLSARFGARLVARVIPREETTALHPREFLGRSGEVVIDLDQSGGQIKIVDRHGNSHWINAALPAGLAPIPRGERALLIARRAGRWEAATAPEYLQARSHRDHTPA